MSRPPERPQERCPLGLRGETVSEYAASGPSPVVGVWLDRFVDFNESSWALLSGSASFQSVVGNVEALVIAMEVTTSSQTEATIDNVSLVPLQPDSDFDDLTLQGWSVDGSGGVSSGRHRWKSRRRASACRHGSRRFPATWPSGSFGWGVVPSAM